MASSIYFPVPPRQNGLREKGRSNGLPTYSSSLQDKYRHAHSSSWTIPISLPIPGVRTRRLRLLAPNPARIHQFSVTRFGRKRGSMFLCFAVLATIFTVFALAKRFGSEDREWPKLSPGDPPTLVFRREDLQRIWKWEITSGHYPSGRKSVWDAII
jgi:WD repeat and SOF domain-containing protein 1